MNVAVSRISLPKTEKHLCWVRVARVPRNFDKLRGIFILYDKMELMEKN